MEGEEASLAAGIVCDADPQGDDSVGSSCLVHNPTELDATHGTHEGTPRRSHMIFSIQVSNGTLTKLSFLTDEREPSQERVEKKRDEARSPDYNCLRYSRIRMLQAQKHKARKCNLVKKLKVQKKYDLQKLKWF